MKKYMGVAVAAALLWAPTGAQAQKAVTQSEVISETFTIEAIDHAARVVTLKAKDGTTQDIVCGPEVQRFDALKVGQSVTFRYHESLVSAIRRPGQAPKDPVTGGITRTPGAAPGGTIARQLSASVTIEAIDAKVPSMTVKTTSGKRMSFRVEDAKNLEGYKAGDTVEITYTQALAVSVQ
jgi:Cu/Ag efflux protein CusF